MRLKDIVIRVAIIAAVCALIWYGLGLFTDTAEDNHSTATSGRESQHERIENM